MKLPRLKAEMSLPELSAYARLRGALLLEVLDRLPDAMRQRTAARGSSGALRAAILDAVSAARAEGFEGDDATVVAVSTILLAEAEEIREALQSEVFRETAMAEKVDAALSALLTSR